MAAVPRTCDAVLNGRAALPPSEGRPHGVQLVLRVVLEGQARAPTAAFTLAASSAGSGT
jgi:hypothetical protein